MSPNPSGIGDTLGLTSPPPDGRQVEVVRTYLSMPDLSALRPARPPSAERELLPLAPCSVADWRTLYGRIGGDWHWHDRDAWPDEVIAERLRDPNVFVYQIGARATDTPEQAGGFLELERHSDGAFEIVYLGLHADAMGMGLGGWLVETAVRRAFAHGDTRLWLHTCTLDSPAALPNYLARGFAADRTETYTTWLPR
jgi:GNAT superfamily N-acetyltransferase